jgi:hypothetical protein
MARSLRVKVCTHCPQRPAGSEGWGCDQPRACEAACPVFVHLPLLRNAAARVDPLVGSRERVLRSMMRRLDELAAPGAGPRDDPPARSLGGRLRRRVVRVIDSLTPG